MPKKIDLTGQHFGRLTVIKEADRNSKYPGQSRWLCQCECGKTTIVYAGSLRRTHSCGCLGIELAKIKAAKFTHSEQYKHGDSQPAGVYHRLYHVWQNIKTRCNNPNTPEYPRYGGRGVVICPEWAENYPAFKEWALSHSYKDHLTIDRIDRDGNYSPANCQWITRSQNSAKIWPDQRKTADKAFLMGFRLGYALRKLAKH